MSVTMQRRVQAVCGTTRVALVSSSVTSPSGAPLYNGVARERAVLRTFLDTVSSGWTWLISRLSAFIWLRKCNSVGANTRTFWRPHIENRGRITIGSGVRINSHWAPVEFATGPDGVIDIADGVYINYGTLISAQKRVHIGADVMIGNFAIIGDTDVPGIQEPRRAPFHDAREVYIGDRVWLAARVTVLPGARIGDGAIIAAGSIVAGDIPANAVAGGIPARVIREAAPPSSAIS